MHEYGTGTLYKMMAHDLQQGDIVMLGNVVRQVASEVTPVKILTDTGVTFKVKSVFGPEVGTWELHSTRSVMVLRPEPTPECGACKTGEHADDGTGEPCPCCGSHVEPVPLSTKA